MRIPPLPPAHELVRFAGLDHASAAALFRAYLLGDRPIWSYAPTRSRAGFAFNGSLPLSALLAPIVHKGPEAGWKANAEALTLIRQNGKGASAETRKAPDGQPLAIGKHHSVRGKANFYYVEDRTPRIVFVQPRRHYNPTDAQLGILGALLTETLLTEDFKQFGGTVEILDLSVIGGDRVYRLLPVSQLQHVEPNALVRVLAAITEAYDEAVASIDWQAHWVAQALRKAERDKRNPKPQRPQNRGLFD